MIDFITVISFVNKKIEGITTIAFMAGVSIYTASAYGARAFTVVISPLSSICLWSWMFFAMTLLFIALRRQSLIHGKVQQR